MMACPLQQIRFSRQSNSTSLLLNNIKKAIETAKIVMGRRKIEFEKKDESMFNFIFELTKSDREKRGF